MLIEDCRGLACPEPVIKTKKTLEAAGGEPVRIIVDNGAPRENVLRFAKSLGYSILEEAFENGWQITLAENSGQQCLQHYPSGNNQAVILIGSDKMGDGPDDLGRLLMKNFIITLLDLPCLPKSISFINSGVKLTTEGSELLEPLQKLAAAGVEIFSCGVCLDYFGLSKKLAAGSVTNMYTIAENMVSRGTSIRI